VPDHWSRALKGTRNAFISLNPAHCSQFLRCGSHVLGMRKHAT
jgi:hypothetical protein